MERLGLGPRGRLLRCPPRALHAPRSALSGHAETDLNGAAEFAHGPAAVTPTGATITAVAVLAGEHSMQDYVAGVVGTSLDGPLCSSRSSPRSQRTYRCRRQR